MVVLVLVPTSRQIPLGQCHRVVLYTAENTRENLNSNWAIPCHREWTGQHNISPLRTISISTDHYAMANEA